MVVSFVFGHINFFFGMSQFCFVFVFFGCLFVFMSMVVQQLGCNSLGFSKER